MAVNDFQKSRHGRKKVLKKSIDSKVAVIRWPLYAIMGVLDLGNWARKLSGLGAGVKNRRNDSFKTGVIFKISYQIERPAKDWQVLCVICLIYDPIRYLAMGYLSIIYCRIILNERMCELL